MNVRLLEIFHFLRRQRLPTHPTGFIDPADRVEANNRHSAFVREPCQRHMTHLPALFACQLLHPLNNLFIRRRQMRRRRSRARRVLITQRPRELPTKKRRPWKEPDPRLAAETNHLTLLLAVAQVVVILHADELRPPVLFSHELHVRELRRPHGARADVAHFTGLDEVVERFHRLFWRSRRVVAVDLEQIDVGGAQACKGGVHGVKDGAPGKPWLLFVSVSADTVDLTHLTLTSLINVVLALAHLLREHGAKNTWLLRHVQEALGHEHDFLTRNVEVPDSLADDLFADAVRIHVGRVPGVDTSVEGGLEDFERVFLIQHPGSPLLRSERHATKDRDRNAKTGGSQVDIFDFGLIQTLLEGGWEGCFSHGRRGTGGHSLR